MAKTEIQIIRALLSARVKELKLRRTADWLNDALPKPFQRSHMTISNWIDGVYKPDDLVLIGLKTYYPKGDERHDAALEIMALREGKSASAVEFTTADGKKLLGVVKIRTLEDGTLVHEGDVVQCDGGTKG
jgi:hypothetical protein